MSNLAIRMPRKQIIRATARDILMHSPGLAGIDTNGNNLGEKFEFKYRAHDGVKAYDSSGAFLVGELERLDQELHLPLVDISWGRDIDVREDVSLGDEVSSFTQSTYGSQGGLGVGNSVGNGKAWAGKNSNEITGISLDINKIPNPLTIWAMELKYSIPELASAARAGRPIDTQKYEGMQLKYQMDTDEQVYIGDTTLGVTGLVNNAAVTNVTNAAVGANGGMSWAGKTPDEILADINAILVSAWTASGYSTMPNRLLIPPQQFGYISTQKVGNSGTVSIMKYVLDNNIRASQKSDPLLILPLKWLVGAGAGGTLGVSGTVDRMIAYTKERKKIRFPMTPMQKTPLQYQSLYHMTTYFCRLGVVEVPYPETLAYVDGI